MRFHPSVFGVRSPAVEFNLFGTYCTIAIAYRVCGEYIEVQSVVCDDWVIKIAAAALGGIATIFGLGSKQYADTVGRMPYRVNTHRKRANNSNTRSTFGSR